MLAWRCQALRFGLLIIAFVAAVRPSLAGPLADPTGEVMLTVSGRITNVNGNGVARFDRAMLNDLPQRVTETTTPWDMDVVRYGGALGRELLKAVGATGTSMKAVALNDYAVTIPLSDFEDYDVILALTRNGEDMKVRDKGPIFIVYPFDEHPELRTDSVHGRSIWQLKSIVVE